MAVWLQLGCAERTLTKPSLFVGANLVSSTTAPGLPRERLSMMVTACPASKSMSAQWLPMKPAHRYESRTPRCLSASPARIGCAPCAIRPLSLHCSSLLCNGRFRAALRVPLQVSGIPKAAARFSPHLLRQ